MEWNATSLVTLCVLVAVACSACAGAPSTSPKTAPSVDPNGFVSHQGRWLTDAEGRILLPHGVNYGVNNLRSTLSTVSAPATPRSSPANGFRAVRLGVQFQALMPHPGRIDATYLHQIVQVVDLLANDHIYTLLDMHQDEYGPVTGVDGFPAWATIADGAANPTLAFPDGYYKSPAVQAAWASFWADKPGPGGIGLQERYIAALVALARRIQIRPVDPRLRHHERAVAGRGYTSCETDTGCPALEKQLLGAVLHEGRTSHPRRRSAPPDLRRAVPHLRLRGWDVVAGVRLTGQRLVVPPVRGPIPRTDRKGGRPVGPTAMRCWRPSSGDMWDVPTIDQFLDGFDAEMIPWLFWQYSMITKQPRSSGEMNEQASAALKALARPYPLAVAGVPVSYGYDPTHTVQAGLHLTLVWTVRRSRVARSPM